MKTAIKLLLIDFVFIQIFAPFLVMIPYAIYLFATTGSLNNEALMNMIMIPAQITGQVMMAVYLWKAGYISTKKVTWSPVSGSYLFYSSLAILCCGYILSALMAQLKFIPNIMEQTFEILQSGWGGILAIAIIGPVLEEVLFRGAITKALLQQYKPTTAILLSALLFGIFHINPVQIIPAFLIGLLLAWIYYKTASLIPCILMHVINNSLSVYASYKYPDADYIDEIITGTPYLIMACTSTVVLVVVILLMRKTTIRYPWKEQTELSN